MIQFWIRVLGYIAKLKSKDTSSSNLNCSVSSIKNAAKSKIETLRLWAHRHVSAHFRDFTVMMYIIMASTYLLRSGRRWAYVENRCNLENKTTHFVKTIICFKKLSSQLSWICSGSEGREILQYFLLYKVFVNVSWISGPMLNCIVSEFLNIRSLIVKYFTH